MKTIAEKHYILRSGWLRAAVLGANDGILSTSSLAIGIAAASTTRDPIILAAVAGLVGGSLSMAAGEYVSVSSQSDVEKGDMKREENELATTPDFELKELAHIYEKRGLTPELAKQVAVQMTAHNALEAHARDELNISEFTKARPFQAAMASAGAFILGGVLPFLVALFAPMQNMVITQYAFAIVFLAISGVLAAKAGGSAIWTSVIRICVWGTLAMGVTAGVGYLFGVEQI